MNAAAVTGATGCLGTSLVRGLVARHVPVRVLTRTASAAQHLRGLPGVSVVEGDLSSSAALDLLCSGSDTLFHLAAKVHVRPRSESESREFYAVNVEGTRLLLDVAGRRGIRRMVYYSTVAVHAQSPGLDLDETSPLEPSTPYARSKLAAEALVLRDDRVDGVVLRFPVAYGARDRGNVGRLIRSIAARRFFWVHGGANRRSLVGSQNAAHAAILAMTKPGASRRVLLITDGGPASLADLVAAINMALKQSWSPPNLPDRLVRALAAVGSAAHSITGTPMPLDREVYTKLFTSVTYSCATAKRVLGYSPVNTLQEEIAEEVAWLQA